MSGRLRDRVAIVTGASRGIGRAVATRFVAEGARVVLVQRGAADGEALAEALGRDRALSLAADVGDPDAPRIIVHAAMERWNRIDILVNNAAFVPPREDMLDISRARFERVLAANLIGMAMLSQAAARCMLPRKYGRIINMLAIQAHLPLPHNAAYAASKGGAEALTRSMAVDLAPHGIIVNAIAPGQVATPGATGDERNLGAATILGRLGHPDEVAALAVYLAGEECSFTIGQVITVDGGRTFSRRGDPEWLSVARGEAVLDGPDS
jgi:NAD(P)-dependent dehydrogenase (short-subunit alcohol dehydrogenase family)